MSKEKEILDKTLTFNYGEMLDIIKDHISTLRFVAISSVNSLEEKDKEIERLKEDNEYLNKVNIELSTEKNRLNNIINELEKWLGEEIGCYDSQERGVIKFTYCDIMDKLQELKGEDKE